VPLVAMHVLWQAVHSNRWCLTRVAVHLALTCLISGEYALGGQHTMRRRK